MSKILNLFIIFFLITGCSFQKNSKFWSKSKEVKNEINNNYVDVFPKEETFKKEFNSNLKIELTGQTSKNTSINNFLNNDRRLNFNGTLKKISQYKFSKIKNFNQYQPEISFYKDNVIFFDSKGSILRFDKNSRLIWKKNYYSKSEKKLKPILQIVNNGKYLIVADNIAKYYMVNISNGNLVWSQRNLAPFNSQIKVYKDKFFIIDFSNTLRCFSLKNGDELWNLKTQNSLIRTQKKLSMVIINEIIYFNNSIGDISAVDINKGELLWQLPTQSSLTYESAFSLQTSDLISDKKSIFFSNNKNQFFSVDSKTGSFNWENKVNSSLRPSVIDNYLFSISSEGYLVVIEKKLGNIIRVTDIFKNFKPKKRNKIKPTGFIVGLKNIYVSTSNGRLLVVDINTGKIVSTLKISSGKISKPFIQDQNLFLIKDNSIVKLN